MIWDICKALFLLILAYFAFRYVTNLKRQKELEAQGVVFNGPFAYFIDGLKLPYYAYKYPYEVSFIMLVTDIGDPKNPPGAVGTYIFGIQVIFFNKPNYLEEIFVTKNAFYTKHEIERSMSRPLLFHNIATMETDDPSYKNKRKALSSAFLKSKMTEIIQMVKGTALRCFAEL